MTPAQSSFFCYYVHFMVIMYVVGCYEHTYLSVFQGCLAERIANCTSPLLGVASVYIYFLRLDFVRIITAVA